MLEMVVCVLAGIAVLIAGAVIFAKGQKIGADIVWRAVGNEIPLIDKKPVELLPDTTAEMDTEAVEEERNNPPMDTGAML